jgi:Transport and Golgi organisation 2
MCLLALFFRVVEDAPLVIGANREELYARGGEPPQILEGQVRALAGRDPVAGGTWFGVNGHGVIVALTNRLKSQLASQPRSRGLLVRDLLSYSSARMAADEASCQLSENKYAGCNVFCGDSKDAYVLHSADWLRVRPLTPGIHVLTAQDVNDESDRRIGHALWWLSGRDIGSSGQCAEALKELCAQPGNGDPPMCIRGKDGGTVSSSIIALRSSLSHSLYLHAQGPPDQTPYADFSGLLKELDAAKNIPR